MKTVTRVRLACIAAIALGTAGETMAQTGNGGRNNLHLLVCLAQMDQFSAQAGTSTLTVAPPGSSSQGGTPSISPLPNPSAPTSSSTTINGTTIPTAAPPVSSSQGGTPSISPLSDLSTPTSTSTAVNDMTNTVLGLMGNSNSSARIRELQAALALLDEINRLNLSPSFSAQLRVVRTELLARLNLLLSSTSGTGTVLSH